MQATNVPLLFSELLDPGLLKLMNYDSLITKCSFCYMMVNWEICQNYFWCVLC